MNDTNILSDQQEVTEGIGKAKSGVLTGTIGKHHLTIEENPNDGLSDQVIQKDLNAASDYPLPNGPEIVISLPTHSSNEPLNSREVPALSLNISVETVSKSIPKDSARDVLCNKIKEVTNLAPIVKDYIFEHPKTVSEFY